MPINSHHAAVSDGALRIAVAVAVANNQAAKGIYLPVQAAMRLVDRSQTPYVVAAKGGFISHDGSLTPSVITADWYSPAEIQQAVKAVPGAVGALISDCLRALLPADYQHRAFHRKETHSPS